MFESSSEIKNDSNAIVSDNQNEAEIYNVTVCLMKEHKEKGEVIKIGNICTIIDDLGKHINGKEVLATTIISVVCVLLLFFSNNLEMDEVKCLLSSILPSLLGFTIAVYTILFGFNETICKRLKKEALDGKVPFEVLHASFVFGLVIQGFSLIVGLLADVMPKCMNTNLAISICWFLLFFSIVWTINMVLHLYALRTFGTITDKKEK